MGAALIPILTTAVSAGAGIAVAEKQRKSNKKIADAQAAQAAAERAAKFREGELAKKQQRTQDRLETATVQKNIDEMVASRNIAPLRSSLSESILGGGPKRVG